MALCIKSFTCLELAGRACVGGAAQAMEASDETILTTRLPFSTYFLFLILHLVPECASERDLGVVFVVFVLCDWQNGLLDS